MDKTDRELEDGLKTRVASYIIARHYGSIKVAIGLKSEIDKKISELGLDKEKVYFYFGDPDNPDTKDETWNKVQKIFIEGK